MLGVLGSVHPYSGITGTFKSAYLPIIMNQNVTVIEPLVKTLTAAATVALVNVKVTRFLVSAPEREPALPV